MILLIILLKLILFFYSNKFEITIIRFNHLKACRFIDKAVISIMRIDSSASSLNEYYDDCGYSI